jgi:hypothetical protein
MFDPHDHALACCGNHAQTGVKSRMGNLQMADAVAGSGKRMFSFNGTI